MILLKCFSVLCRRVSILLFEIPDELGCIGIADGITDFIELLVRDLEQLFCLLQLRITKDLGKGNAPGSEPEFSFHWIGGADTLFLFERSLRNRSRLGLYFTEPEARGGSILLRRRRF